MLLNCHSYYSFLYGTLPPKTLVAQAKQAGATVLVLTDINNTSGWYDFLSACKEEGIKPLLGLDFRHEGVPCFIAIAKNNSGIYDLNVFLTEYSASKTYTIPPESEHLFIMYHFSQTIAVEALKANEFIGIRKTELGKLYGSAHLHYPKKLLCLHPVTFKDASDYSTHQLLQAIDQNTLLSKIDTSHTAKHQQYIKPIQKIEEDFKNHPFLCSNTNALLAACEIDFDLMAPKNKKTFTGSKAEDKILLEKLAYEGCQDRYGTDAVALERLQKELRIIEELNFSAYFLITWDIVSYASGKGFRHVGRGSGANSIVAYCLRICEVDPIELNLYFERFINPYRSSPPDFDIDFSWDERDEVIEYIFKRHGKEHVCLLATYSTFQNRSIIRELGKVYGLPKDAIDTLVEEPTATYKHHDLAAQMMEVSKCIEEFPAHLSIHAGGILITEEPIYNFTALELMPKGFPVCHFDMHVADAWGFYKYDILSQRGLGHIKEAVDIIDANQGISVDIHRVKDFYKDPLIKKQLQSGQSIGCFYVESPAMRGLLTKLRCDNYISLVAASSIIRPGVAKSGMMREYITRSHHPEKIEYIHPKFKEVLEETYGVMVYQEDVIKIAHHFAGLDLGEADILRRGMSGKSRTKREFLDVQEKYFANCAKLGYSLELATEVWRQIESFSGFSFCKAHSASYAVESYQSLFLKAYYPLEFMVAVINNFGGFYNTELYVHEARISGAVIEAPCVNNSQYKTSIRGKVIYLGFIHILNLEAGFAQRIITERESAGIYLNLNDFIKRTQVKREQLNLLIKIGALRFTGKTSQALLWLKNDYLSARPVPAQALLIDCEENSDFFPEVEINPLEEAFHQMELLGFPLCSPFELLKKKNLGVIIRSAEMKGHMHKTVRMAGYFVAKKNTLTSKKELMNFGTFVDDTGRFFDTVHFPPQIKAYPFTGKGCYLMLGKVVHDFDFPSLEVQKMIKLPMVDDPRY